jgi:hypothetical protein
MVSQSAGVGLRFANPTYADWFGKGPIWRMVIGFGEWLRC